MQGNRPMSTQLAQFELDHPVTSEIIAPQVSQNDIRDADLLDSGDPTSIVRGIVSAVLIATPFWVLFAFALYLLI